MAKISMVFDTIDKTMTCLVDGQEIPNVVSVSAGQGFEDEFSCSVTTSSKDESNDMRVYTHICAAESREGKLAPAAAQPSPYPGMVWWATTQNPTPAAPSAAGPAEQESRLCQEVADFFGVKDE